MGKMEPPLRIFKRDTRGDQEFLVPDDQVDKDKMTDLMISVVADVAAMPWDEVEPEDMTFVKNAVWGAVLNALSNEKGDGFHIPPIADSLLPDGEEKHSKVPDDVNGPDVLKFLHYLGQKYQATTVRFSFVDEDDHINTFVMQPLGRVYHIRGNIEGTHFKRTLLKTEMAPNVVGPWKGA